jgi:phage shock protein A
MRLFQRIGDIISANLNELIDGFENPEIMLKQAVREMDEAVTSALQSAVKAVANEKLLARELAATREEVELWLERATQAVTSGDDELARRALTRKLQQEKLVLALEDQFQSASAASASLRRQIEAMRVKLAEAKRKQLSLIARRRAAEARRHVSEVSVTGNRFAAFGKFDQLVEQVETAEAEADALAELTGEEEESLFAGDETLAVEQALTALKANRVM